MKREKSSLGKLVSPPPPPDLRGRALQAAEDAWRFPARPSPARLARFGPWDWAWAAALVLLVAANALVDGHPRRRPAPTVMAREEKAETAELARLGIVLPQGRQAQERPGIPRNVDDLSDAAGAGL